jgi:hypothetical protein
MTMIELTAEELRAVAGGQNHGQATTDAVRFAQDFVYKYQGTPAGGLMGTEVSYFARNGLLPS